MSELKSAHFFDGREDRRVDVVSGVPEGSTESVFSLVDPERFRTYLVSKTRVYGEVRSHLSPGFDEVVSLEGAYEVSVPESITSLCELFQSLGGRALLVGGSIRDAVISQEIPELSLSSKDFDMEVYGIAPEDLRRILDITFGEENVRLEGEAFQVYKVSVPGIKDLVDISIPRRDNKVSSTSGRGRGFLIEGDPTMDISEAASRRDLVFNSLAYDPLSNVLYDPYDAVGSIRRREIEVTDPEAFIEDALRVLRVMQFAARFDFIPSSQTISLCKEMVESGSLDKLPKERITEEFVKLFTRGIRPSVGLEFIRKIGLVDRWFPELAALRTCSQEKAWHPEGDVWTHTLQVVDAAASIAERESLDTSSRLVLCLASLGHDLGKPETTVCRLSDRRLISHGHEAAGVPPMEAFFEKFSYAGFSKGVRRQVYSLIPRHLAPKYYWQQENPPNSSSEPQNMRRAVRRLIFELEEEGTSVYMLSLLAEADQRGRNGSGLGEGPLRRTEVEDLEEWQSWISTLVASIKEEEARPGALVSGDAVMSSLGLKQGPEVGAVLWAIVEGQLLGELQTPEAALLAAERFYEAMAEFVDSVSADTERSPREIWVDIAKGKINLDNLFG